MGACLRPQGGHPARYVTQQQLVCAEPGCGFLLAGAMIDHWQVTTLLNQGPAADLYLATDASGGRSDRLNMLVKVLRAPTTQPPVRMEAVLEQLSALHHPHIHPLQGLGWTAQGGSLYLLSQYEEQGSLLHQSGLQQRLPPLAVAGIVRQIAEALQYAHERHIVHGRLKPENCLIVAPATIQVCDFYHSLLAHEDYTTSPYFVAPEQFLSQAEPASDQYALAVITYQLLTARFPLPETEPLAVMAQQLQSDPLPISTFRSDLPRQVDMAIRRALSKQPHERFPAILAFAVALQSGLETSSRATGPLDFPRRARLPETAQPTPGLPRGARPPEAVQSSPDFPRGVRPLENPQPPPAAPVMVRVQTPPPGGAVPLCLLPGHTVEATVLRWAPGDTYLASAGADRSVRLWLIQQQIGAPVATLEGHTSAVLALSWSPNGTMLASAAADATLRIWDVSQITRQPRGGASTGAYKVQAAWWGHDGSVAALDWSPDGTRIASGGTDRTIRLWDKAGKSLIAWQAHGRGGVSALAWSPDSRHLASGGTDHQIILWDPLAGASVLTCEGHTDEICHLAWSPDGRCIASAAGKKDLRVCVWNAQTGQRLASLSGNTREVVGVFWSSDSAWLATAAADRRLRFWSMRQTPGQQIGRPIEVEKAPSSMAGASQSGLIALGLADMMILVLQLTS